MKYKNGQSKDLKVANWLEGEMVRRADGVIAISDAINSLICTHHGINPDIIYISPLGIAIPELDPIESQHEKVGLTVLFVGRLEKRKGVETLFRAIPIILDDQPETNFIIVGQDSNNSPDGNSYKEYLLNNLDIRYHNNILFMGFLSDEKLIDYYNRCDLFVAPLFMSHLD